MPNIVEDFTGLTMAQLTAAYNAAQPLLGRSEDDFVKKFRDAKTGVARLEKARDELMQMHGHAVLRETEDETLVWETEKPSAAKPASDDGAPRTGVTTLDLTAQLHLLVSNNPKRPGSRAFDTFVIYEKVVGDAEAEAVATGESFVKAMVDAGYSRKLALSTLHWDMDHGYICLGPLPEKSTEEPAATEEKSE